MKKQSRTKYTVLGMLTISPMSGYEIKKTIHTSTSSFWAESDGQIYPALSECVAEGLVSCREAFSPGTQRAKKIYNITSKGKNALTSWLAEGSQAPTVRNELLLKLFFGNNVDTNQNIHHVKAHENEIRQALKMYSELEQHLKTEESESPHLKYWLITLDYGKQIAKAKLNWCQQTLTSLKSK